MEEKLLRQTLSANIKKYRGRKEWSQVKFAKRLGISANFLAEIETGKSWVSPLTLSKMADALGVEVYELFKPQTAPGTDPPESLTRFADDMTIALQESLAAALSRSISNVREHYAG
jgi:transcriptional regulator with XRE-family HTH domain